MKRFSFSLERVLEYRRQVEDVERARLAGLVAGRSRLLDQAAEVRQESQAARLMVQTCRIQGTDLRRAYEYASSLERHREQIIVQADRVDADRRSQLAVVLEARRQTRLLELLRSKKLRQYRRLADREQENLAGELYLAKISAKKI